ncbi:MAG TPA: Gfo/Idh/MocA family oxidoreductase [Bryobacteraceae bacterium]|nr:Gfo/Idh/MocA family oxidoreductase [Bryobacteraceae bacterium]
MPLNIAIAGCGRIGTKRAAALGDCQLAIACDVDIARARALGAPESTDDWQAAVTSDAADIVIVATTHDMLATIAAAAARAGKHVLIEKPGARRAAELDAVAEAAVASGVLVRVGFNHRYHRAVRMARALFDAGEIGPLMFIRGRYGHGGRLGYEREWRANPAISGGGELLDQGIHLIDLSRWFLGEFARVTGRTPRCFWQMPVEDNAFLMLETEAGQLAWLHASWTEWKNTFSFEICGRDGKLEITGLGGSYGTERLTYYEMSPEMGPPETRTWEFPTADNSWDVEFGNFLDDIRYKRPPRPGIADAQAALRVVERVYQENAR